VESYRTKARCIEEGNTTSRGGNTEVKKKVHFRNQKRPPAQGQVGRSDTEEKRFNRRVWEKRQRDKGPPKNRFDRCPKSTSEQGSGE